MLGVRYGDCPRKPLNAAIKTLPSQEISVPIQLVQSRGTVPIPVSASPEWLHADSLLPVQADTGTTRCCFPGSRKIQTSTSETNCFFSSPGLSVQTEGKIILTEILNRITRAAAATQKKKSTAACHLEDRHARQKRIPEKSRAEPLRLP